MNKEEFKKLKEEWEQLNKEYDAYIEVLQNGSDQVSFTDEQVVEMKEMQEKLYKIEKELFKNTEGQEGN